ncbi:hypothetical protein ACGTN9_16605 [Halobacillus sp. MO56]
MGEQANVPKSKTYIGDEVQSLTFSKNNGRKPTFLLDISKETFARSMTYVTVQQRKTIRFALPSNCKKAQEKEQKRWSWMTPTTESYLQKENFIIA